jgi:hypothetical protein
MLGVFYQLTGEEQKTFKRAKPFCVLRFAFCSLLVINYGKLTDSTTITCLSLEYLQSEAVEKYTTEETREDKTGQDRTGPTGL